MLLHDSAQLVAGDTWPINGELFRANGDPFDLSAGVTIEWRLEKEDGTVVLSYALGSGIEVLDVAGKCRITVPPDVSRTISPGCYRDQLRATSPDGFVSTQWVGRIDVKASFFVP